MGVGVGGELSTRVSDAGLKQCVCPPHLSLICPSSLPRLSLFSPSSRPLLALISLSSVHLAPSSLYLPPPLSTPSKHPLLLLLPRLRFPLELPRPRIHRRERQRNRLGRQCHALHRPMDLRPPSSPGRITVGSCRPPRPVLRCRRPPPPSPDLGHGIHPVQGSVQEPDAAARCGARVQE